MGNFTKAAEELHITQPGLSIMIRQMESQLGYPLFYRTTRTTLLTEEAEHLLPAVDKALTTLDQAVALISKRRTQASRRLLLGVTPLVSSNIFPEANKRFNETYPEVKVSVVVTSHDHIQALVEAGELDFGLGANFNPRSDITCRPLFQYDLMWVAPANAGNETFPDLSSGLIEWSAVRDYPIFGLPTDNHIQHIIETRLAEVGRGHEERTILNNFETLIAMVSVGAGTAIMPSYSVDACRRYGVQAAILTEPKVTLDFYQITKRGRQSGEMVERFIEAFRNAAVARTI